MTRIYTTTFAETGDKETLAATDPGTGKVSLPSGWTPDYEKLDSDPSYRPVGRKEMNGVINEVTAAIGELQQYGFAPWQALTGGWPLNARVVSGGIVYKSTAAANTATPPAAPWVVEDAASAIHAATAKSVLADADEFGVTDSASSFGLAKVTWAQAKGMLGNYMGTLFKVDSHSTVFTKTGAGTVSIKAGTIANVLGTAIAFPTATAVVMPALVAGTDYAIYACQDGTIRADASFSAPVGYTTANSRQIGGFHYGLTAPATTLAAGAFATTGNGMIWVQSNVDDIAGINKYSLWDLKWLPRCDPRGMALVSNQTWVDIYLCSTDTAVNGTSKYNTNIASGTVLPKIPAAFNGNGTTTYPTMNWWVANELARANQKRLMWEHEFVDAAFGVTESQSIDATASTYPTTRRNAGYTSKYGIEQASGHQWTWGQDSGYYGGSAGPWNYYDVNGNNGAGTGRGQIYQYGSLGIVRAIFGGSRSHGANSGSRASNWIYYPWVSDWNVGLRAACDHLILV